MQNFWRIFEVEKKGKCAKIKVPNLNFNKQFKVFDQQLLQFRQLKYFFAKVCSNLQILAKNFQKFNNSNSKISTDNSKCLLKFELSVLILFYVKKIKLMIHHHASVFIEMNRKL